MTKYLLLAAFLVLFPIVAIAQGIEVVGKVTGPDGKPLPAATISFMQHSKGDQAEIRYQELSGDNGEFKVIGVAPGTYAVTVIYPGLKPAVKKDVAVSTDSTVTVDFTLGNY